MGCRNECQEKMRPIAWRFHLRTLFAAVTLLAGLLAVWLHYFPPSNRLRFPRNTPKDLRQAVIDAYNTPITEARADRPGWANVGYTEPMTRIAKFGDDAVPALIANIDNRVLRLQILQLLGDLHAKKAVPVLLDRLEMEDSANDVFIVAKLAEITEHPEGYGFYRRWFDEAVQQRAVATYRKWWAENKVQ